MWHSSILDTNKIKDYVKHKRKEVGMSENLKVKQEENIHVAILLVGSSDSLLGSGAVSVKLSRNYLFISKCVGKIIVGSLETRNVRGPTLLRDIWTMPPGKTIDVQFNSRNQAIGKKGRKLASFLGIVARTPELTPLNVEDWRCFDKEEKSKLVEFKFSIPAHSEEFVKRSLGKKWKDYNCDLRSMYLTKYKTKDTLLKNRPSRISRDQWIGLVSYCVSDKGKRRSQANRSNRAKQKMPHMGGSKSIGTLMTKDGIEPTQAEVFILTHKKRKDGRPLDEESIKALLNNGEISNEQHLGSVAWEGDVYSQVFGSERSGYIRGLGLGLTPSLLWGNKSSLGNISTDNMSNETIQKFKEVVKELKEKHDEEMNQMKELNQKQDAELNMMKQNQEKLMSELSFMRQVMCRFMLTELPRPNFNGSYFGQAPDASSGHEQAPQVPHMSFHLHSIGRNTPDLHAMVGKILLELLVAIVKSWYMGGKVGLKFNFSGHYECR
ncbi:transposase, Ptta/En/Spm, plant [Spatholobus suberectus]|nr:transposase, Ptta/En/Spm, plant [Spatholobus suberectus]